MGHPVNEHHGWCVPVTRCITKLDYYPFTWAIYDVIYGITVILDHQNIGGGGDVAFSVLSCLVQEIWCKIHNSVMAESKMAAMAATSWVGDDSISQDVQKTKPYKHTKFHALRKKCLFFLFFLACLLDYWQKVYFLFFNVRIHSSFPLVKQNVSCAYVSLNKANNVIPSTCQSVFHLKQWELRFHVRNTLQCFTDYCTLIHWYLGAWIICMEIIFSDCIYWLH